MGATKTFNKSINMSSIENYEEKHRYAEIKLKY